MVPDCAGWTFEVGKRRFATALRRRRRSVESESILPGFHFLLRRFCVTRLRAEPIHVDAACRRT